MRAALLAVFLVSCAAPSGSREYHQSAFPTAPPFSATMDAPIMVGQPGFAGEPEEVPRGKDRRVLPPTQEPGIWASDGDETRAAMRDRADRSPVYVAGVKVQLPGDRSTAAVRSCADIVDRALTESEVGAVLTGWDGAVQRCEVLRMVENCLARRSSNKATTAVRNEAEASQRLVAKARATACEGISRTPEQNRVRATVIALLRRELGNWQNVTELDEDLR